jgi:hypothetical protein
MFEAEVIRSRAVRPCTARAPTVSCCGHAEAGSAPGKLRADGLPAVAAGDLDVAWLGGFADRDGQGEHARGVVGGDLVGVEGLAEENLPGIGAVGPLGDQPTG